MTGTVQLQASVDNLSLAGLGAFTTILVTLSSDNVSPMAMIQLEQLGAVFHVSGPFAQRVPDLLTRSSESRIGNLAVMVGWKKGDSSSLLAQTAAGQAIAITSLVFRNIFGKEQCGEILFRLSSQLLSHDANLASIHQLAHASDLLASKLSPLRFGNHLPKVIMAINQTYQLLKRNAPSDLLECFEITSFIDIFQSIGIAMNDDTQIVRISGTSGMGYIAGFLLFLFPNDTTLTVEDSIIRSGERKKVLIDIKSSNEGSSTARPTIETALSGDGIFGSALVVQEAPKMSFEPFPRLRFSWNGWLHEYIQMGLFAEGFQYSNELWSSFCEFLVFLATTPRLEQSRGAGPSIYENLPHGLSDLLNRIRLLRVGHDYWRIEKIYQEITSSSAGPCPPATTVYLCQISLRFSQAVTSTLNNGATGPCKCSSCEKEWNPLNRDIFKFNVRDPRFQKQFRLCIVTRLGAHLYEALPMGLICFSVNAHPNATVGAWLHPRLRWEDGTVEPHGLSLDITDLILGSESTDSSPTIKAALSRSNQGTTVFPTPLQTLRLPTDAKATFELLDGLMKYKGRYHTSLVTMHEDGNPDAEISSCKPTQGTQIVSSGLSCCSKPNHYLDETANGLQLTTRVTYDGAIKVVDLRKIIRSSFHADECPPCPHPTDTPLDLTQFQDLEIIVATVFNRTTARMADWGVKRQLFLSLTASCPTSQLLCCGRRGRILIMSNCCLPCAVGQAAKGIYETVIVT